MKILRFTIEVEVTGNLHHHTLAREARLLMESRDQKIQGAGWCVKRGKFKLQRKSKTP